MKRVLESTVTDGLIQEYTNLGSVSASTAEASLLVSGALPWQHTQP